MNQEINFRKLKRGDIEQLVLIFNFPWTTEDAQKKKWEQYYREEENNTRFACILEYGNQIVAYGSLLFQPGYSLFSASACKKAFVTPGTAYPVDDDLLIWLKKKLR